MNTKPPHHHNKANREVRRQLTRRGTLIVTYRDGRRVEIGGRR